MKPYLSSALVPSYIMRWGENLDGVDIISRGRSKTFTRGCPLNVRRGFVVCSRVQKRGDYAGIISERMWTKYLLARAETSGRLVAFVSYPGKDISCSSTCVGTGGRSIGEDHQKKTSNVHACMGMATSEWKKIGYWLSIDLTWITRCRNVAIYGPRCSDKNEVTRSSTVPGMYYCTCMVATCPVHSQKRHLQ